MKRRIFLYNAVVVLLALIVLLAVSGLVIRRVSSSYRDAPPPADGSLPEVQSLLEDWQQERTGWHDLDEQLRNLGYALYVCIGSSEVYSSMSHIQWEMVHQLPLDEHWPTEEPTALWMGSASVVGMRAGPYAIFAMGEPSVPKVFGRQRLQTEALLLSVLIIGATTIVVIVLLSMLSTHFQVKHILRPVNALTAAARRIEAGDYSQGVGYDGQDEFTAVCAAFEHMQRHLLLEREKNAAYERARTDLVAGISHDLRTPLTSILGYLQLLEGDTLTPEERREYLGIVQGRAKTLQSLIVSFYDLSRLEGGEYPLARERVDLYHVLSQLVAEFYNDFEGSGFQMTVELQEGLPPVMEIGRAHV